MDQTSALGRFKESVSMVEELLEIEKGYQDPPRSEDTPAVYGLRGAAAVLMFACWEQFLRELFEEQLKRLQIAGDIDPIKLPERLKYHNATRVLDRMVRTRESPSQLSRTQRLQTIQNECDRIVRCSIEPEFFCETYADPGPNAVETMFERVGMNNVFLGMNRFLEREWNTPLVNSYAHDKLEEIRTRRHNVAHRAYVLNISRRDLVDSVRYLNVLTGFLSLVLEKHIGGIIS